MFPQIFGKYVLEREIAAGGMARVFLATLRGAVGFEKRLVVKQIRAELAIDDAFVRRFVEEAKTAVELSHPNIVPVYELGVEQGVYYIAMEHCAGVTLADALAHTGPLDADEGAYVGAEVCRALDYAFRRAGIVHRDVTPRNVLLDDEGGVRLIDFGIAAPVEASSGRAREVFGSPGHMPPEQLRGDPLGPSADVFAVGVLLIEAWTGEAPFRRATPEASLRALRSVPPPIDRSLPELTPLADLIRSSVELDPSARPAGAEQLARGLRDFLRGADSVEVGRRLAERVRRVRDRLQPEPREGLTDAPHDAVPDSTPALVTPAGGTPPVTQTFAARDEMVEWTRKWSSAPPPPQVTRRLSTPPLGEELGGIDAFDSTPAPKSGSSTPTSARSEAGVSNDSNTPPSPRSGPTASADARSRAVSESRRAATQSPRRAFRGVAVLALAVPLLLVIGLFAWKPPAASPPGVAAPTTPAAPPLAAHAETTAKTAAIAATARLTSTPPPTVRTDAVAARPSSRTSSSPSPSPAPSALPEVAPAASAAPASATLRISADPPAIVTVEGADIAETRGTPVRALTLRPGAYRVSFRSETYGSPVATQVTLSAGAVRTVHADFRAAVPTVTVR